MRLVERTGLEGSDDPLSAEDPLLATLIAASVRSTTRHAILSSAAACNATITQSPELAPLIHIGSEDIADLDEDQRVRFSFLYAQIFGIFENLYLQYTQNGAGEWGSSAISESS